MNIKKIILALIILFVTVTAVMSVKWRSGNTLDKITVSGNYTIPELDILSMARLNDSILNSDEINIDLIQDRIAKHPEIKKVFVSKELASELKIEIIERRPVAILNGEDEINLIDDELEIFPFKNTSKMYDLPVISGVRRDNNPDPKKKYEKEDLRLALFIILNSYKESKAAYNCISEINLSDTGKAIVYLSEDSSPFYFPRKYSESISNKEYQKLLLNKLVVFENYIKQSLDNHLKNRVNYVDLRFENEVIVNSNNLKDGSQEEKKNSETDEDIIVGLDVGTTKICVIVARVKEDDSIDILGIGKAPSFGLHRGIVVNPNKTTESIKAALEEAELNSGVSINSVSVGIAGHYIRCIQSSSIIGINNNDRIIQEDDIARLIEQAKIMKMPSDTTIIDVIPQEYVIDGKDGIFETPVGMFGIKLEAKVNIITGLVSSIDDLSKCVTSCDVDIDDIVLEPIASSYSVLDETEKKVGVGMIDIGGGTSDIAVFKKGVLKYTAGIGIAGNLVTNDIVEALGISENEAERIKREYGYAMVSEILNDEEITVESIKGKIPKRTSKSILARIIQARMQDIFELSAIEIQNSQIAKELHAGVVITGGGSLIKGTKELAEDILGMEVNLGIPTGLKGGLIKEVESPIFATGVGLVLHRLKTMNDITKLTELKKNRKRKSLTVSGIFSKIQQWFDEL